MNKYLLLQENGIGPAIFNISEPITFGLPIILNPIYLVPFVVAQPLCFYIAVFFTKVGFIGAICNNVPWTCPPVLSGLLYSGSINGAYTLLLEDCETSEKVEIQDIMVGDVYIAAGQSNMEFLFENSKGSENEKINVDKVNLRYWKVPQIEYKKDGKEYPKIDDDGWFLCTKENVGKVSAVAYYCAKEIRNHTDVPIGIIGCHKGGTSASCWISEESLQSEESLSDIYYDQYWNDIKDQTDEQEDREREKYQQCLKEYNQKVEDYKKKYPERSVSQLKHDVGHTP